MTFDLESLDQQIIPRALDTISINISTKSTRRGDRIVMVALDLSKAFDTFNHVILFEDVEHTTLRTPVTRGIQKRNDAYP